MTLLLRTLRRCGIARLVALASVCSALAAPPAAAAPITFNPLYTGNVATQSGAQADFRRIDNAWHGSQVLWTEPTQPGQAGQYGVGTPIGGFGWGSGIWGQADWQQVMSGQTGSVQQWSGIVNQINFGNARYNECYAGTWGAANLGPLFAHSVTGTDCADAEAGAAEQMNWTTAFNGLIRITEAGRYNFGVLYDDGFFFRLVGAGGVALEIGRDFLNPRDRLGFEDDLLLQEGLYGFELGSWNRLGAGVVDLRWSRDNGQWELVPVDNFAHRVPEPALPALLALACAAALGARRRPRRR